MAISFLSACKDTKEKEDAHLAVQRCISGGEDEENGFLRHSAHVYDPGMVLNMDRVWTVKLE